MRKVVIIGCGNVGSYLSYLLVLRNLEDRRFDELTLVDYDVLDQKNLPFLTVCDSPYEAVSMVGLPKPVVLANLLDGFDSHLKIRSFVAKYPNKDTDELYRNGAYFIDCRDSNEENSQFHLSIRADGFFGAVTVDPKENKKGAPTNYMIRASKYSSLMIAALCTNFLFDEEFTSQHTEGKFVVDLRKQGGMFINVE